MNVRDQQAESTKNAILKVAAEMFLSQGYQATSTRKIAQELNITQPNMYHYYKNKKVLYIKALELKISKNNILISKIEDDKSKIEKNKLVQKEFIEKIYSYIHIMQNQVYSAENISESQKSMLLENLKKLNSMLFLMNLTSIAEFNPEFLQIEYEKIDLQNFLFIRNTI